MLLVGLAFFIDWLCMTVFSATVDHAALITAIIFILLGLVVTERPEWFKKP